MKLLFDLPARGVRIRSRRLARVWLKACEKAVLAELNEKLAATTLADLRAFGRTSMVIQAT